MRFVSYLVATALLFLAVGASNAQTASTPAPRRLVIETVDEQKLFTLASNTRPEANAQNDRGAVSDDLALDHMEIQLRLPAEKEQELEELIRQLHDPNSPNFHNWLTAEQFKQQFSPASEDVGAVTGWLQSHGMTVNVIYPRSIDFSGSAGQVRAAFRTEIHNLEVSGVAHIANMRDPQIPAALAPVIAGVFALNDFMPRPMLHPRAGYTVGGGLYAVVPADLATIYNLTPLFNKSNSGQSQTIVVLEDSDVYSTADWSTFRSVLGLSGYTSGSFTQMHPAPPSGNNNCRDPGANDDDSEAILDAEWASAAAPNAAIVLASCRETTNFGAFIALQNLLNATGTPPAIVSLSYGGAESELGASGNAAISALYQQAAAEGVSVFAAAGDEGAAGSDPNDASATHGINVSGFASTAYNVAVGGTDFGDTYAGATGTYWSSSNGPSYGSAESYIPEIPWDDSCANGLIASYLGFESSAGTSGFCNSSMGEENFLTTAAGSGGPSGCATGAPAISEIVSGTCAGYAKPSWQSVVGNPADGVRDLPDLSLFAANGVWGHYYVVCYSDTRGGGTPCTGAPSSWSGFGGTSFASPIMAGIQALVNQSTGSSWGNPNPTYYSLAASEYGTAGAAACNSNLGKAASSSCIFYDVTQGDMDVNCTGVQNCYLPSGTNGVLSTSSASFQRAYGTTTGWDFATGIGTVNAYNLVLGWPSQTLRITTSSLPNGEVGTAYSQTLSASGGTTPYTWALTSGTLPGGLSLNMATGVISGTPTVAATADPLTFKVTDSSSPAQTTSVNLTLTIASATLAIATSSLPSGQVGTAYSQTLTATGGTAPFAWSITSGTLPNGLSLNMATGVISGTPTVAASADPLTFKVTDSSSPAQTTSVSLTLTIASATLAIATSSLPSGQVGTAYSQTLTATGGTAPYTWSITSGTLPSGLTLNSATGAISGTPTAAASSVAVVFKVTDSSSPSQTASASLTLTIAPATLAITTASLPSGKVGVVYSQALSATGGTTPYTWVLASGSLPAGLSLNALTGLISGTPTAPASASALSIRVTDSGSPSEMAAASLTLTIAPATLAITTTSVPTAVVGIPYSAGLAATGGTTPYLWTLSSGTLPSGVALSSSGVVSGTPTTVVTSTLLVFKVTDSGSPAQTANASFSFTTVFPFTVTFSPDPLSIASPGGSGTTTMTIAPADGFAGTVNLSCSVAFTGQGAANDPPTCSLGADQVSVSGAASTSAITVNTTAASISTALLTPPISGHKTARLIPSEVAIVLCLLLAAVTVPRRSLLKAALIVCLFLACFAGSFGCGGGGGGSTSGNSSGNTTANSGTTTGTYNVVVTAAANSTASTSATISLSVQ